MFGAKRMATAETCVPGCTTYVTTIYGEPTLHFPQVPTYTHASEPQTTVTKEVVVVPTAAVETCPTPGTYTFPATTLTVTATTTVCGASSTTVPAGTHTVGGVTTVVTTATTVVCPYATTEVNSNGVVTSVIKETTYVCPSAGTYTIAPITTTVPKDTTIIVPVVETYCPGTYTRPEVVTTVTETSVIVVCPFTTPGAPHPTSEAAKPTTEAAKPTTEAVKPTTEAAKPTPEAAKSTTEAAATVKEVASSASSSQATATGSSAKSVGGSGDHWAMTYTPYANDGTCKSKDAVDSDIAAIAGAGFTHIRVYSTDCDTLPNVGAACAAHGVKMILGVFIHSAGCTNSNPDVDSQINAIASWAQWNLVELIVLRNEAIFGGFCTASQLAGVISSAKSTFAKAGYTGPCTTSEVLSVWQDTSVSSALCGVIDVTGANIHAYFNAETSAENAGDFVAGQLSLIDSICPGLTGVNLECGWPSAGSCNGAACPGTDNQAKAISSIREKAGSRTVFFSFLNDLWKEPGSCGCEQSWGCGSLF